MTQPLLQIRDLNIAFETSRGLVRPVRDSNLTIYPGQTVALVGESGCGKSVTAMSILKLLPMPPAKFLGGQILYRGQDIIPLPEKDMRRIRGGKIAMIFQEPMTSLNPVYTVGDQIVEAVRLHQNASGSKAWEIAEQALADVGIADPAKRLHTYPHQLSGGMRQRVMIAMALACKPDLLIADEPTTALDVTIQAQILELLRKLQKTTGMSILMITHDLGVVAENADSVYVMYASRIVEAGSVEEIFDKPTHPYTRGLLRSMPTLGGKRTRLETIPGNVPNPANFPEGCKFHTRCTHTRDLARKLDSGEIGANLRPDEKETIEIVVNDERARVVKRCVLDEPGARELLPKHWISCHQTPGYDASQTTKPDLPGKRSVTVDPLAPDEAGDPAMGTLAPVTNEAAIEDAKLSSAPTILMTKKPTGSFETGEENR
jgi:oligopeptide/dipeptide ABC transporter ATP-binding protein